MNEKNLNFSGIYQIVNETNGKIYIGSAINIRKRWNFHKRDLKLNKHTNPHLQRAYNKYGKNSFIFEILQKVKDKEHLIFYEQKWLDLTQCYISKYGYPLAHNLSDGQSSKLYKSCCKPLVIILNSSWYRPRHIV